MPANTATMVTNGFTLLIHSTKPSVLPSAPKWTVPASTPSLVLQPHHLHYPQAPSSLDSRVILDLQIALTASHTKVSSQKWRRPRSQATRIPTKVVFHSPSTIELTQPSQWLLSLH